MPFTKDYLPLYSYNASTSLILDPLTNRTAVLKTVPIETLAFYQTLLTVTPLCSALASLYDVYPNEDGKTATVVREYVDGTPLCTLTEGGKTVEPAIAAAYCMDICRGLSQLHKSKLVHRDITPNNIIITREGRAVIIDYGIIRSFVEEKPSDTRILGTPGYAAPEQFGFSQSDARTDIYAIGVLLNVLLTSSLPSEIVPAGEAGRIIKKCTEIDARKRFANADAVFHALKTYSIHRGNPIRGSGIPGIHSPYLPVRILSYILYPLILLFLYLGVSGQNAVNGILANLSFELFVFVLPFIILSDFGYWQERIPPISALPKWKRLFIGLLFSLLSLIIGAVLLACFG